MATLTKRLAFDDPQWTKADLLSQVRAHRKADELIHGVYWVDGRGCAVGCMAHTAGDPHAVLSDRYGVEVRLFRLCDVIFEGLEERESLAWPERFVSAIRERADTSLLWHQFAAWLLAESGFLTICDGNRDAIDRVANLHRRAASGESIDKQEWLAASVAEWAAIESGKWSDAAEYSAWSASASASAEWSLASASASLEFAAAAWAAARLAAPAKWSASAAWSAAAALASAVAWSVAVLAVSTEWSGATAAGSAAALASAASWATAARAVSTAWSAEEAAWRKMADQLVELLEAC